MGPCLELFLTSIMPSVSLIKNGIVGWVKHGASFTGDGSYINGSLAVPMIVQKIKSIAPGGIRTFFCSGTGGVISGLESALQPGVSGFNLVCCSWETIPCLDDILNDILGALARMALTLWPGWSATLPEEGGSGKWLERAASLCRRKQLPLPKGFSKSVQVQQLSEIMGPGELIIVLALGNNGGDQTNIFSFVKACQWVASESSARVAVLLPPELSELEEIEAISYGAVRYHGPDKGKAATALPSEAALSSETAPPNETVSQSETVSMGAAALPTVGTFHPGIWERKPGRADEKKASTPLPELGVPHPLSQGEQLMAATLAGDPGLSALFEFNRKVRTLHGRHYIVDLLWEAGKVVVEIDGYTFHGTRSAFASDRNRDYELMISSYIVLRIPHWEVMDDLDHALEKIRDIVAFRRKEGLYGF